MSTKFNKSDKRSGFSMIELVFVIVILGVLAAVAVPRFVVILKLLLIFSYHFYNISSLV